MKKLLFAAAAVWLLAACNKELGPEYETPPVFDEVTFTTATQPDKITEPVKVDEVVWVNATVSCPYKVKQVWLAYFVDGDESNVVTTKPFNYDATTVTFKERIPGQKAGAKVSFQVLTRSDYVFMWTQTYTYKVEGGEDEEKPNPDLPDENYFLSEISFMELKEILAISGQPGLYKYVAQSTNGVIVESLLDGRRMNASASSKVSSLTEISMFTEGEDIALADVFTKIYAHTGGKEAISPKEAPEKLKAAFAEVLPEYDRDRVHVSDMKKCFAWYNILVRAGFTEFKLPSEAE